MSTLAITPHYMPQITHLKRIGTVAASVFAVALLLLVTPQIAHAEMSEDLLGLIGLVNPLEFVPRFIAWCLRGVCEEALEGELLWIKDLMDGSIYTSFTALIGGEQTNLADAAARVADALTRSVGYTILTFGLIFQLMKLADRMHTSDAMPMIKDLFMLIIFICLMKFVVDNAVGICVMLFEVAAFVMQQMSNVMDSAAQGTLASLVTGGETGIQIPDDLDNVPQLVLLLLAVLGSYIVVALAWLLANVLVWARGIQLYAMMALSPIPLACIAADETRQMAVGFIKTFLSVCLSIAVIMFIFMAFPFLMQGALMTGGGFEQLVPSVPMIGKITVLMALFLYSLVKSGAWARDIMGG